MSHALRRGAVGCLVRATRCVPCSPERRQALGETSLRGDALHLGSLGGRSRVRHARQAPGETSLRGDALRLGSLGGRSRVRHALPCSLLCKLARVPSALARDQALSGDDERLRALGVLCARRCDRHLVRALQSQELRLEGFVLLLLLLLLVVALLHLRSDLMELSTQSLSISSQRSCCLLARGRAHVGPRHSLMALVGRKIGLIARELDRSRCQ